MNRLDLHRVPVPPKGKTFTLDGITVRMVPIPGQERAAIRVRFEILDGERIAATMLSCPSADDCRTAVRKARQPALAAVPEPKPAKFNPELGRGEKARTAARRARQMAEEAEED